MKRSLTPRSAPPGGTGILFLVSTVLLSLTLEAVSSSGGGRHVSIKSKYGGQLVTSSTLRWRLISGGHYGRPLPIEAVSSGTGSSSRKVCRAVHHAILLVGETTDDDTSCAVGFIDKVHRKTKFEVLINTNRAARLEWKPYNRFAGVPEGAVAGVDEGSDASAGGRNVFVGRHLLEASGRWRPGSVEVARRAGAMASFGFMRVYSSDEEGGGLAKSNNLVEPKGPLELSSGDVLVEVEPVRYELEVRQEGVVQPGTRSGSGGHFVKKVTQQDVVLANTSLFRFEEGRDREARLHKVLSYAYEESTYFGQAPGMIRALPTAVSVAPGNSLSVLWGLPDKSRHQETLMVGHSLTHHSAVDVSVVGVLVTEEQPYRATLTSVFADGTRRERQNLEGIMQTKRVTNVRPEYSRVYQIRTEENPEPEDVEEAEEAPKTTETTTYLNDSEPDKTAEAEAQEVDNLESKPKRDQQHQQLMLSDPPTTAEPDQDVLVRVRKVSSDGRGGGEPPPELRASSTKSSASYGGSFSHPPWMWWVLVLMFLLSGGH